MAKLQQNLLLQGLQFSVSDQARKEAEQSMLPEAIANLESQAKSPPRQSEKRQQYQGIGHWRPIAHLPSAYDDEGRRHGRQREVAQPDLQPGQSQLQLQVSGKVELK